MKNFYSMTYVSSKNRRWPEEFDQAHVAGVGFLSWFYLWSDTDQMIFARNTPWSLEIEKFPKTRKKKFLAFFFICDRNHRFFWSLPTIPMIRRIFYRFSQIFHRFFTDFSDFRLWRTWEDMGSATTDFVPDQMIVVQKYSLIFRSQNMQKKFFDRFLGSIGGYTSRWPEKIVHRIQPSTHRDL